MVIDPILIGIDRYNNYAISIVIADYIQTFRGVILNQVNQIMN